MGKFLTVKLPCNPIFPIGPIYQADHIHKCFPNIEQQFIDLAVIPPSKVKKYREYGKFSLTESLKVSPLFGQEISPIETII